MSDTTFNKVMLQALTMLKETPIAERRQAGICNSILDFSALLDYDSFKVFTKLRDVFRAWPLFSGNDTWPVGTNFQYWGELDTRSIWMSQRRIELLDFAVKYMQDEVDSDTAERLL